MELDAIIDELQAQMAGGKRYHIKQSKIRSGEVCGATISPSVTVQRFSLKSVQQMPQTRI